VSHIPETILTREEVTHVLIVHAVGSGETRDSTLGVERHVVYLAAAQRLRGHQVSIFIDAPGTFSDACAELGIPVVVTTELKPAGAGLAAPDEQITLRLTERLKELGPDLVHCHSLSAAMQTMPVSNRLGIPCVFDCESLLAVTAAQRLGMRFATVCISRKSFDSISKAGVGDVYYVPTGTRAVPASPSDPATSDSATGTNLIFAGSLIVRKGLDVALLTMAELRRRRGKRCPVLNIYGSGEQARYLKEMAAILGLDDIVTFHGIQKGILERCPSSDILLLPSRLEFAPLVVLEAMSRGMPVVATDVGDVAMMIPDERFGRVVPVEAVLALADAVESMLADIEEGRFDPRLPIERHRAVYSDEVLAENTSAVYERVLQS
jgi:glycosyltransferase involved in cell wall biosynthesis